MEIWKAEALRKLDLTDDEARMFSAMVRLTLHNAKYREMVGDSLSPTSLANLRMANRHTCLPADDAQICYIAFLIGSHALTGTLYRDCQRIRSKILALAL